MKNTGPIEKKSSGLTSTIFLTVFALITLLTFIFIPILISLALFTLFLFPILLYIILGKLTKHWGISALLIIIIQVIFIVLLCIWLYYDTSNLINNLNVHPKYLFYYDENNTLLFAYEIKNLNANNLNIGSVSLIDIVSLNKEKTNEILGTINKKDKFVLILNKKVFEGLPEILDLELGDQKIQIPKQTAFEILKSDNPKNILLTNLLNSNTANPTIPKEFISQLNKENLPDDLKSQLSNQINLTDSTIKLSALGLMLVKTFESKGTEYMFGHMQDNNIQIKPNYALFWALKNTPYKEIKPYLPDSIEPNN